VCSFALVAAYLVIVFLECSFMCMLDVVLCSMWSCGIELSLLVKQIVMICSILFVGFLQGVLCYVFVSCFNRVL
jgi:hypothetical protein